MFLFNKRTRNIIKYIWAFFAIIISLTMVIAYSGFASLARTQPAQQQIDVPDEVRQQLLDQQNGVTTGDSTSSKEQAVLKAIEEGKIDIGGGQGENATTPPPAQEFKLEI